MLSYSALNKEFPMVRDLEPDKHLILFAYNALKNDIYVDDMLLYLGMLKFILKVGIEQYREEYKKLYFIYRKVFIS